MDRIPSPPTTDVAPYRKRVLRRAWSDTMKLVELQTMAFNGLIGVVGVGIVWFFDGIPTEAKVLLTLGGPFAANVLAFLGAFFVNLFAARARLDGELRLESIGHQGKSAAEFATSEKRRRDNDSTD